MKAASCRDCIWHDQCAQEKICEYFTPTTGNDSDNEDDDSNDIRFYEQDLKMRGEIYAEYIKEDVWEDNEAGYQYGLCGDNDLISSQKEGDV